MEKTMNFLEKIQGTSSEESVVEISAKYLREIKNIKESEQKGLGELYYSYALFLFNNNEYKYAIKMFSEAYNLNVMKSEIRQFLFDCFVYPNKEEFKITYEKQLLEMKNSIYINEQLPCYEELPLVFFPYEEDRYYIFDTENDKFEGIFDVSEELAQEYKNTTSCQEFEEVVVADIWNIDSIKNANFHKKENTTYCITSEITKLISFLQVPNSFNRIMRNFILFDDILGLQSYFHKNKSVYLPKQIYAPENEVIKKINEVLDSEHKYRLTSNGREIDRIILTIAIPTYNRGDLALANVRALLEAPYDAEIEILVSNNCSTKFLTEYKEIEAIQDSRLSYYELKENIGGNMNFCNVIGLAKGKYVCLLSDEDSIYLPSIPHYLSFMKNNPNVSFIMAPNINECENTRPVLYKKGKDAFLNSFLQQNYITGLIYRTDLYDTLNLYDWTRKNIIESNMAFSNYSQTCWASAYSIYGDFYADNVPLCIIGKQLDDDIMISIGRNEKSESNNVENEENLIQKKEPLSLIYYSTLESRLEQHKGFVNMLNELYGDLDNDTFFEAYAKLILKTFYLVSIVKDKYVEAGEDWKEICEKIKKICIEGIYNLKVQGKTEELINLIDKSYCYFLEN